MARVNASLSRLAETDTMQNTVQASERESAALSDLPPLLAEAMAERGFDTLTPVQQAVLATETSVGDLRITSKTGSGKTIAVGIAIGRALLQQPPAPKPIGPEVLVLAPTRELAQQVKRELSWLLSKLPRTSVDVVTGGTSIILDRKALTRLPRVLVGTPGRVLDHLRNNAFSTGQIRMVILDEADQMLDMGFRDDLEAILDRLPENRATHLVSATFAGPALQIAERYQAKPIRIEGTPLGSANLDIQHIGHIVPFRRRYEALVNVLLMRMGADELDRTLIFTRTRADTAEFADRLQRDGFRADPLSGDLAQAARNRTLQAFRTGQTPIVVATDVAARGLDVDGVSLVVHLDPPGDADALTHRSGRTGRAGQKGTSILMLPPQARGRMERMLRDARINIDWAPLPAADKIHRAFTKLGRRRIYSAFEQEPMPEHLQYAQKLLGDHEAETIIATLLGLIQVDLPCSPKSVDAPPPSGRPRRHNQGGPGRRNRGPSDRDARRYGGKSTKHRKPRSRSGAPEES